MGRYREFYQADIDVIGQGSLPLSFDAEMPLLLHKVMGSLPLPKLTLMINNRKLMEGFYRGLGVEDIGPVLRAVDKLAKVGAEGVKAVLTGECGMDESTADQCLALAEIRTPDAGFAEQVRALGVEHPLLDEGIEELRFVMELLEDLPRGAVLANLSIARGLDYYTGTVYEGLLEGHENLGSVCSGGRYDNLVQGETRVSGDWSFDRTDPNPRTVFLTRTDSSFRSTPTCVLVALNAEESRKQSMEVADHLRARDPCRGIPQPPEIWKANQIRREERDPICLVSRLSRQRGRPGP